MDRLSDRARLVLQCGAILGLEFSRELLEFFEEVRAGLHDQLRLLKAKAFLEERSKRPDLILRFCHPLTRDVAYQALLPGQRRALHRHVAERIEAEFPEPGPELQEALAHHWWQGEQPDKAAYWLIKCADARERLGGYQAAIEAGTKALQLLDASAHPTPAHLQRTLRLLMRLARLETDLGRLDEGAARLQRVAEVADRLDNDFFRAELALWRGVHAYRSGDAAAALPLLEEAESRARNLDLPRIFVPALNTRGLIAWQQARAEEALGCFDEVAHIGAERNAPSWQADAFNNAGLVLWRLGRLEEALDRFRASLPLRRAIHDRANTAVTLLNIGSIQQTLGRLGDAENSYADCEALARRIGHHACLLALHPNRSVLALHRGDLAAAADHAARGIHCAERAGDLRAEACARLNLADTLLEMERLAEAALQARRARQAARRGRCDEEIRLSATLCWIAARLLMQDKERGANAAARPSRTASDLRALRRVLPRCEAEATLGRLIPRALALQALAHTLAGRAAEAAEAAQRARNALAGTPDPLERRVVERLLAVRPAT
jgi:tetratricopeptide (TPR) repeat protein